MNLIRFSTVFGVDPCEVTGVGSHPVMAMYSACHCLDIISIVRILMESVEPLVAFFLWQNFDLYILY
jgi:hypothetical protein